MKQHIAIIDYGMGNLHSAAKALEHVAPHALVQITSKADDIANADRVVFPGVGAIRDCMAAIVEGGFDLAVRAAVASGKPVLGICVGLQALLSHSEENGGVDAIGLFPGQVKYFGDDLTENGQSLCVPHMGWNAVKQKIDHPLWDKIDNGGRFYFVHSYYPSAAKPEDVAATCNYGIEFDAVLCRDNLFAVQFHPEKSAANGLQLLKNFSQWRT